MQKNNLQIPEGLDPDAVNLARAIRQQESGGDYNATGDGGTSRGAYQWQQKTWLSHAQEAGLDPNDFSPKNQDMVAYHVIKKYKDSGLNVPQIAAIWNGGDPNRLDPNYVTKSGLPSQVPGKYDVPKYARSVNDIYQNIKQQTVNTQPQNTQTYNQDQRKQLMEQGKPVSVNQQKAEPTMAGGLLRGLIKGAIVEPGLSLVSGAKALLGMNPETTINTKYLGKVSDIGTDIQQSSQDIADRYKQGDITMGGALIRSTGTPIEKALNVGSFVPGEAVVGNIGKSLLGKEIVSPTIQKVIQSGVQGAGMGAGYGFAGSANDENATGADILTNTVAGGVIGGVAQPALEYGAPALLKKGGSVISDATNITKGLVGKPNEKVINFAQKAIDKEVDRVAESLPISYRQSQKEILNKTGSNGFSVWKQHALLPEQVGNTLSTDNIIEGLKPFIEQSREVTSKFAKAETNTFNVDKNINEVLEEIDKLDIPTSAREKIAQEFISIIGDEIEPQVIKPDGRYIDAEQLVKLKRILYNAAGFSSDLPTQGKAGKIVQSPFFSMAKKLTENVDQNATLPEFKKANKIFSDYLSAEALANKLNGKVAKSSEGLVNKLARRTLFGGGGAAAGGLPGAYLANLAGESMDRFYTDPSFRTSIFKKILEKNPVEPEISKIGSRLEKNIQKRGTTKVEPILKKRASLVDKYKYKPEETDIGEGFILKNGKVTKKTI